MKRNRLRDKKWYNNAVAILIGAVGYVALSHIPVINKVLGTFIGYFKPVLLGCVIAYLVHPLASLLERKVFHGIKKDSLRWTLSIFAGMLVVVLLFLGLLQTLIPQLIESISKLMKNMDSYIDALQGMLENAYLFGMNLGSQTGGLLSSSEDVIDAVSQILQSSMKSILSASAGIGRNIVDWLLAFVLSIYLLGAKDNLKKNSSRLLAALLPENAYRSVMVFLKKCNEILVQYIVFSLIDAVIVGGATAAFMLLTRMDYVGLVAVVCGVTNLIPSFGPIIGGAIGAFILLLVNPIHALIFIAFTAVLQLLDGYVIKPKLFGDSLGVSGLLILIAIIVFGNIFGIVGILLAIPLAAILDFAYEHSLLPFLERRRKMLDAPEETMESGS